jgi:Carboxypeptidase regulatory-like domain
LWIRSSLPFEFLHRTWFCGTPCACSGARRVFSSNTTSNGAGGYLVQDLSIGTYTVTITAAGFNTEKLTGFLVHADRTSSLQIQLKTGNVSVNVDVSSTAQLNTTDPTNGHVLDATTIENTPLGTGSFTQTSDHEPRRPR